MRKKLSYNAIIKNFKSGITISLISIPLSVSLAVASGVQPVVGIITACWAGLVASIFGGSNYNIIGPTGALSGIIAANALQYGVGSISALAVMAGFFILAAYALRLERFLIFIPSSVIHGFTLGVALIISSSQITSALGLRASQHPSLFEHLIALSKRSEHISVYSFMVFLIFLAWLFILRHLVPQVPGALVLTPIGIMLGYCSHNGLIALPLETLGSTYGELTAQLILFPTQLFNVHLIVPAITVACVALLETMLSAKIADGMTATRYNGRKEMRGLGLANIVSGLMGGMPATAALARTALNIKIGATSTLSAFISSIFVAFWAVLCLKYFTYIPLAVIAAILVYVAINMIEREHFERLWLHDKTNLCIALLVAATTVYKDPIIGIFLGTGLSLLVFVEKLSHGHYELLATDKQKAEEPATDAHLKEVLKAKNAIVYTIKGPLTYINSQAHITRFETKFSNARSIIVSLSEVTFIDIDGIDALDDLVDICAKRNQHLLLMGASKQLEDFLRASSKHFKALENKGFILNNLDDALRALKEL